MKANRSISNLGVVMLDFLHELSQPSRHRSLLSIHAKRCMVRTDVDLAAFNDVSPMIQRMLDRKEFSFLCRVVLFRLCQLLGFECDGMESDLVVWVFKRLLEDCADAILRGIRVYDERLTHPRVPQDRI